MQDLLELFRYNARANGKVFDLAAGVDPVVVDADAPGTHGTVKSTLAHLASVEAAYLAMLEQRWLDSFEPRETYFAHDPRWFAAHIQELGAAYLRLLESTPDSLDRPLQIPWFTFPVSAREGLRQVLTHSAQHRSQVLSWLSTRGVATPDLDYVLMLRELRQPA
jgi:uncharacterized damage-inducible protein DinB